MNTFNELEQILEIREVFHLKKEKRGKLLIVDDNFEIIYALEEILKEYFEVLNAHSCEDAVQMLDNSIKIVILDIKMWGKDGFETFSLLKNKCPGVKIVFHSAYPGNNLNALKAEFFSHSGYYTKGEYKSKDLIYDLIKLLEE
ncbi:MAG: response regulator [Leptospiraceae bacterium]|nr:response regulator [Leptospiraceae bacterium]MCP5498056.1 response regulator [Leptospiraceae bacterium]